MRGQDLVFAGLIGMIDPPRDEARDAVSRAKRAGIRSIMITGDHPKTASVIAMNLGIAVEQRAVTGSELEGATDFALAQMVKDVSVYARVNPAHKLRIVKALQRQGAVVAMTGDGVNDAPALKMADIGVAMGTTGTDVSKQWPPWQAFSTTSLTSGDWLHCVVVASSVLWLRELSKAVIRVRERRRRSL